MSPRLLAAALSAVFLSFSAVAAAQDSRTLLILSRDGAFAGNLAALAGRPVIVDGRDSQADALLLRLTDAHGWSRDDRAGWRTDADLAAAARAVCDDRAAALAILAQPGDDGLEQALTTCSFRVIDLGDAVSRGFVDTSPDLRPAAVADDSFGTLVLGAATLRQLPQPQMAARRD